MNHLPLPTHTSKDTIIACADSIRKDAALEKRLKSVVTYVSLKTDAYLKHARAHRLDKINPRKSVKGGMASKYDMKKAYKRLRDMSSCRPIYNDILGAAEEICPLCNDREASTLDHYLPKSKYPTFAVTPVNLVPCCYKCNNLKKSDVVSSAEKQFLHPYFDDVEHEHWLFAKVIQTRPATITFFVNPSHSIDATLRKRLEYHVQMLKLQGYFTTKSQRRLTGIRKRLKKLLKNGGAQEVKKHLKEEADSYFSVSKNHWETAFYQACAKSRWFCKGGFSQT